MESIKFAAFQSVVDASFFHSLAAQKLEVHKLEAPSIPVRAAYTIPFAKERQPVMALSNMSTEKNLNELGAPGQVDSFNTIEEFKKADKMKWLREMARVSEDWDKVLEDPELLNWFAMIVFADLKKYLFTYWCAFPTRVINWKIKEGTSAEKLEVQDETELKKSLAEWQKSIDINQIGFFFTAKLEDGWTFYKLSEHKKFQAAEATKKFSVFWDPSTYDNVPGWPLRNYLSLLNHLELLDIPVLALRELNGSSFSLTVEPPQTPIDTDKATGWERLATSNKLAPKQANLGSLLDPRQLADQAVDLNLKLMKWRIAPDLDLDIVKNTSCLLLGAGTLGSYIARALLGWGVRKITFVDNGKVSYSNPVRQPLYTFADCQNGGAPKAEQAAKALKTIYPGVESEGINIEIPMAGHPVHDESIQEEDYNKLTELIKTHDVIFLLVDSRESRWLPTVIAKALGKSVINAALGFDSYVVMRHADHLGCYFCSDVVAPIDSLSNRTLDQMCTVTRPGVAMLASAYAVELLVTLLQHPDKFGAPVLNSTQDTDISNELPLNAHAGIPHQLRGFLGTFETIKVSGPPFHACSACSEAVVNEWKQRGWDFVKSALNYTGYVEDLCGLAEVKQRAEEAMADKWDEESDEEGL